MRELRLSALIAALAGAALTAGCASGTGASFTAASASGAEAQASQPPPGSASGSGDALPSGGQGQAPLVSATGGGTGRSAGRGRIIYVSGNVLLPQPGLGGRSLKAQGPLGAGLTVGAGAAAVKVAGLGVRADPLGVVNGAAGGAADAVKGLGKADPLAGVGRGRPVLGRKPAAGVTGSAGRTAGSLIGSGGKGADSGVNLLTGLIAGGRHHKPG